MGDDARGSSGGAGRGLQRWGLHKGVNVAMQDLTPSNARFAGGRARHDPFFGGRTSPQISRMGRRNRLKGASIQVFEPIEESSADAKVYR